MFDPTEQVISPPRAAPRRIKAGLAPSGPPVPDDPAARLRLVAQTVREMSRQTEPVSMIRAFTLRMNQLLRRDRVVGLSRRDVQPPQVHITRCSDWAEYIDPWKNKAQLPLIRGGILSDLIYGDELRVIDDFEASKDDPAYEYLEGMRSLLAIPIYDSGLAINMVVMFTRRPAGFDHAMLPDLMLSANLFGKATQSLVLASQLQNTNAELDWEMKRIGQLQRALLPAKLPEIPGVGIAVSYETAARAGGDYYDFFDLGDGRWGVIVGDVSGHGAPAAVVMAMTRTLLHAHSLTDVAPEDVLAMTNRYLAQHNERYEGTFVTAFYAIFDPRDGSVQYASAGHNPPLLMRLDGTVLQLDQAQSLPLGVVSDWPKAQASVCLRRGDSLMLYTDGITEACDDTGEAYGLQRLYDCMSEPTMTAREVVDCTLCKLRAFTDGRPPQDDRTLLAIRLKP